MSTKGVSPSPTQDVPSGSQAQNQRQEHYIVAGETLSELALKYLGNANRWPELVAMNPQAVKSGIISQDGQLMKWGFNLIVRNGTGKAVTHKALDGETAQDMASRFLDDPDRWGEILAANPGKISADGQIKPGSTLTIPNDGPAAGSAAATKATAGIQAAKANPDFRTAAKHTQWTPQAAKAKQVTGSSFTAAPNAATGAPAVPPKVAPPPPGASAPPKVAPPPPPSGPPPNVQGKGSINVAGGVLSGQVAATVDQTGVKAGTALLGFKTAIGSLIGPDGKPVIDPKTGKPVPNTNIDVTNGVTITNNKLTKEQFEFVIGSQFGMGEIKNIKANADNTLTWTAGQGVSAQLKDGFTAAYKNLTFGDQANLTVQGGQISGTDRASVSGFFNNGITFTGQGGVTLSNDKITAADIKGEIDKNFGTAANPTNVSLSAELQESTDPKGVKTGTAVLGFKEAIGVQKNADGNPVIDPKTGKPVPNATIDVSNGITITNNKLSDDDFKFVIGSQFGMGEVQNIKANASGQLEWKAGEGVSGAVKAGFTAAYNNLTVGDQADLTLKNGQISGTDKATVNGFFNNGLEYGVDNTVVLKNGQVTEDDIDANVQQSFGGKAQPTATLGGELKVNVDSTGIKSGSAVLGFKEAIGTQKGPDGKPVPNTTIDVKNGITITNNKLTADDFNFVIGSQFGQSETKNIKTNAQGQLEWKAGEGVSGQLKAGFTASYNNLKIGDDANLTLKNGQISGTDKATVNGFFKNGLNFDAANTITLKNGQVTEDQIQADITKTYGPNAHPTATISGELNADIDSTGIKSGTAVLGFKEAIGVQKGPDGKPVPNTTIDVSNGITITNNKLTADDFKFVIGSQFGQSETQNIKVNADGNLEWKAGEGVSGQLKAGFTASYNNLKIGDDANLTLKNGQISGTDKATVNGFFKNGLNFDAANTITLKNGQVTEDQIQADITKTYGPNAHPTATISGELNADIDSTGIKSGTAVLGFKEAIGTQKDPKTGKPLLDPKTHQPVPNTTIDVKNGITITNNKLTADDFAFVIGSQFGQSETQNIKMNAKGQLEWKAGQGVSGQVQAGFTAAYNNLKIGSDANLTLKNNQISGTDKTSVSGFFKNGIDFSAQNTITLKNGQVTEDQIKADITKTYGPQAHPTASISGELTADIDASGIKSGTAVLGFKEAIGVQKGPDGKPLLDPKTHQPIPNTNISVDGGITITNNKLSDADFKFVIGSQFGQSETQNIKMNAKGQLEWKAGEGVSGQVQAGFKASYNNLKIGSDANLTLKNGQVSGTDKTTITNFFNNGIEIGATNNITLKNGKITQDDIQANIRKSFGPDANPTASISGELKATVKDGKLVDTAVSISAVKTLKNFKDGGQIKVGVDNTIESVVGPDGKRLTTDDLSGLISLAAGKEATLDSTGHIHFTDGSIDAADFQAKLGVTLKNTTLTGSGKFTLEKDPTTGKWDTTIAGEVGALFNMGPVQAGVDIKVDGVSEQQINLKIASSGKNAKLNGSGGLTFQNGKLVGGQISGTSGLVSGGKSLGDVTVGGGFVVTPDAKSGNINLGANIGPFAGSLGVSASATTKLYTPDPKKDPQRAADSAKGVAWSLRQATFNIQGSAGANINVPVGGVPVTLGFKADGSKGETVMTLSREPDAKTAQSQPPVLVMHPPKTVDDILKMGTHEQVSQSGNQSIGMAGNVDIGYAMGPANITVGGSVYHQITGDMNRDIERLDGNKVRVRFTKGSGSTTVATFGADVGLNADKALPGGIPQALKDKAKPIVEKVASAGISAAWSNVKENDTAFDVTIDLSTPQGKAAMEHLLKNDLSEAQYWAQYNKSGVSLNSAVSTNVHGKKRTLDIHLSVFDQQHVNSWLDAEKQTLDSNKYELDEAQDSMRSKTAFFGFDPSRSTDMRLTHETSTVNPNVLPNVDTVSTSAANGQMQVRTPPPPMRIATNLSESKAVLGMRIVQSEKQAGLHKMEGDVDPALSFMQTIGVPGDKLKNLQHFRDALTGGITPNKKPILPLPFGGGIGDKRFGNTSMDYEVFVSPQGLAQIANGWDTSPTFYQMNYLLTQGNLDGKKSIFSRAGMIDAMQQSMGATITADKPGQDVTSYTVTPRSGAPYKITSDQLETLRLSVVNFQPPQHQQNWQATFRLADGKTEFTMTQGQWIMNSDVLKRSQVFGREMSAIANSYVQNAPPLPRAGESDADFQKRKAAWKPGPLYNNPEAFWAQASQHFENVTKSEHGGQTAAATLAKLAGSDKIFARAEMKTDPAAAKAMVDAGVANVQHFAAVDMLAANGAKVYTVNVGGHAQQGLVFNTPPGNLDSVTAAAKNLFGPNVQVSRNGAQVTISNLKWPSNQYMDSLYHFLDGVTARGTHMIPPASWSAQQTQKILGDVFGNTAVLTGGEVYFDNRNYGIIHFGEAIKDAGPAFVSTFGSEQVSGDPKKPQYRPPARFPLVQPVTDEGPLQLKGDDLWFKYYGSNEAWGTSVDFAHEADLHGIDGNDHNDLSVKPTQGPQDRILTGQ